MLYWELIESSPCAKFSLSIISFNPDNIPELEGLLLPHFSDEERGYVGFEQFDQCDVTGTRWQSGGSHPG